MATSNDLMSYSIMNQNKNASVHKQQISLPPLEPIIKQLQTREYTTFHNTNHNHNPIRLPPLNSLSNYTTSHTGVEPVSTYHKLTENNLMHLGNTYKEPAPSLSGLGLLSATIASIAHQETYPNNARSTNSSVNDHKAETLPSLTSSSSASSSPMSSPSIASATLTEKEDEKGSKRRQRLGPSCDSCRLRKVKCNAEIVIISKTIEPNQPYQYPTNLSISQMNDLNRGEVIKDEEGMHIIISNGKLIRFKSCKSCNVKGLACCFSKGFTKEDIMINNKKSSNNSFAFASIKREDAKVENQGLAYASVSPVIASVAVSAAADPGLGVATKKKAHKIAKKKEEVTTKRSISSLTSALSKTFQDAQDSGNTRKSSCVSCRKRKVKCLFNSELNKCEGCNKKNHDCVFEKR